MRQCGHCRKNLKKDPANILWKEGHKAYLICDECIKTKTIQNMIENGWSWFLSTPTLDEMGD